MNKLYHAVMFIVLLLSSCQNKMQSDLPAFSPIRFKEAKPWGMVAVDRGAFRMGTLNDSIWGAVNDTMTVSIENFWMDEYEVSNFMYRHFVNWVRDSILRERLSEVIPAFKVEDKVTGKLVLNWKQRIPIRSKDPQVREVINRMYYYNPTNGKRITNARLLNYEYEWIDLERATLRKYSLLGNRVLNTDIKPDYASVPIMRLDTTYLNAKGNIIREVIERPILDYKDYFTHSVINVYPDTNCWKIDFYGEKNDMYLLMYFASPAYYNYPVVGVSWEQANAFCFWRTKYHNISSKCEIAPYRLPTEAEWEYVARGGKRGDANKKYPWKGDDMTDKRGQYFANFKPLKGNFPADKYLITAPIGSFPPNDIGIYDLVGNVAEWTSTAYFSSGNKIMSTMNATSEFNTLANTPYRLKRKVVRGGSFKDVFNFVNVNLREWKYQNEQKSYIGFRCVRNIPGER